MTATTSVIAASSTTLVTSTAFKPSGLVVEPNFLPEIGFVRRTDMRRNFGLARYSPRPRRIPNLRRFTTQVSLNYLTNNENRLDTREATARVEAEFTNSDLFSVAYTDNYERLARPFAIATGVTLPVGSYDFYTTRVGYIGGQQRPISGEVVLETAGSITAIARPFR